MLERLHVHRRLVRRPPIHAIVALGKRCQQHSHDQNKQGRFGCCGENSLNRRKAVRRVRRNDRRLLKVG